MTEATDATLNEINIDDLGRMFLALTQEVWIIRDRMAITEQLLELKAGITADMIDDYVADPGFKDALMTMRDQFAGRVLGAPVAARERSVDQILERAGYKRPQPVA